MCNIHNTVEIAGIVIPSAAISVAFGVLFTLLLSAMAIGLVYYRSEGVL